MTWEGVRLFVGGQTWSIQGERDDLGGDRCYTAAHPPKPILADVTAILDSGAFTDPPHKRLTPEQALARQLAFEDKVSQQRGAPWQAAYLVSYDLLIDEVWSGATRHKRRWRVSQADRAVSETVSAARYLASQRDLLAPRRLMLSLQGVDSLQYTDCAREVLRYAQPDDVIGLGGWCILGRWTSWLPEFWATIHKVLPLVQRAGVSHVHILGVMHKPALGGLLWLADSYGIRVSTDSSKPLLQLKRRDKIAPLSWYWRDNIQLHKQQLADLRQSRYYVRPPVLDPGRQLELEFATQQGGIE